MDWSGLKEPALLCMLHLLAGLQECESGCFVGDADVLDLAFALTGEFGGQIRVGLHANALPSQTLFKEGRVRVVPGAIRSCKLVQWHRPIHSRLFTSSEFIG